MTKRHKKRVVKKYIWIFSIVLVVLIGIGVALKNDGAEKAEEASDIEIESETKAGEEKDSDQASEVDLKEQADAEYEKWLAATMVVGISLQYPEFENIEIFTESTTALGERKDSKGVYVLFEESGKPMAIHSKAIDSERDEEGTRDISSQILGFASFDQVDPEGVNTESMTRIEITELEELIKQSMLVSIYEH